MKSEKLKGEIILVVDDEEDIREILESYLLRSGARVLTAANGKEAYEMLQSQKVDLIISDVCMPEMDGEELLRRIRLSPVSKQPFFFISGNAGFTEEQMGEIGATGSFQKPFQFDEIENAISEALSLDN